MQFTDEEVDRLLKSYLVDVLGYEWPEVEQNNIGDSLSAIENQSECMAYMGLTNKEQIDHLFL